ncbi:hypothetical protein NST04_16770 [Paenibacillus sp. FSL H7-0756]|uniref:hypothetical protein n=1 Tax=unclassified Paenibacillus TaxID=185978 RepID=UPI0030F9B446
MRKQLSSLIISIILLLSITACKDSSDSNKLSEGVDLSTFLQTATLPNNLTIAFDVASVKDRSSAKTFKTGMLELDPDMVKRGLLLKEVVASELQAVGQWVQTGDNSFAEYLTVYDGGKAFGKKVDVNGGLSYTVQLNNQKEKYPYVIAKTVGPPDMSEQLLKSKLRSDYASTADLSFMSYTDALTTVKKKLESIGFPPLILAETYSLDLDTMRKHYALYLEENKNQDNLEQVSFSKEDEAYEFHFLQQIDDIPFVPVPWEWKKGTANGPDGNIMKNSIISVTFTKNGIISLIAQNLFDIEGTKEAEEKPLIGAAAALEVLFSDYKELLLDEGTKIVSAELNYVSMPDDQTYQLIPAWVFQIAKPVVWSDPNNQTTLPFEDYSKFVVNAITGDKISGMR